MNVFNSSEAGLSSLFWFRIRFVLFPFFIRLICICFIFLLFSEKLLILENGKIIDSVSLKLRNNLDIFTKSFFFDSSSDEDEGVWTIKETPKPVQAPGNEENEEDDENEKGEENVKDEENEENEDKVGFQLF